MAFPSFHGQELERVTLLKRLGTVLTALSSSRHGTGHTSRFMRFVLFLSDHERGTVGLHDNNHYQQILQKHATDIAETYTVDKPRWQKAAADLRQPFWDWARNMVPPPEVISMRQVTITGPDGNRTRVDNPLFHYRFHPIDPSFPRPYSNWPSTFRHPTTFGPDAEDNVRELQRYSCGLFNLYFMLTHLTGRCELIRLTSPRRRITF